MEKYTFIIRVPLTHIMLVTSTNIRQTQRVDSMDGERFRAAEKHENEKAFWRQMGM